MWISHQGPDSLFEGLDGECSWEVLLRKLAHVVNILYDYAFLSCQLYAVIIEERPCAVLRSRRILDAA